MAKKRLRIKDSAGNPVDYDVSASSVTLGNGTDVQTKINELGTGNYNKPNSGIPKTDLEQNVQDSLDKADSAIQGVLVNGEEVTPNQTTKKVGLNIPSQVQTDWEVSDNESPAYIKNKPNFVSQVFYETSTGKIWVESKGKVSELVDLNSLFSSVSYNSQNNIISFLNKRGIVVATLNASPFVVDGFVDSVELDNTDLVITFNTASGKSPIRVSLSSLGGQGTVQSVKMNGGSPIQPVDGVIDLGTVITQHQDISDKADKSEMSVVQGTGADADKTTITLKNGTSAQVINQHQSLDNYASKTYVDNKLVEVAINEITNLSGDVGISNVGGTTYIMFGSSSSIETTDAPSISHSEPDANGSTVTITNNDDDTNAVIRYTTDGTTPTAESNVYSTPFTVNSAVTVKAIAYAEGKLPSAVASHAIEGSAQPVLSISNTATSSTITATGASGSTVYISTDGTTWTSGIGTGAASTTIQKTSSQQSVTVYAYAKEAGKLRSAQVSGSYTISEVVYTTLEGTCQNAAPFNVTIGSTQYPVTPTGNSAPYSWSVELDNVTSLQNGDGGSNNIFGNSNDTNILSITAIPTSVTEIGIRAFANMNALTSFTTGGCSAIIRSAAFKNDDALVDLTITDTCDVDWSVTGNNAPFFGCKPTILYLGAGITNISDSAFSSNTNLTTLEIKSKNIGTSAFRGCKSITSLILHEGVEIIGDYAFSMGSSGTYMSGFELVIPSSCKEIKQDAFEYCKSFASVEIKRYVPSDNDYPITKLSLNAGVTSTGELGFSKTASFPIYVPDAALATYQADQYWSEYGAKVKSINEKTS